MANCCGGKNAGKRISWRRYLAGLGVFVGYHGTVLTALHVMAVPFPELKKVRDFQRNVFLSEFKEIVRLDDINVNGRLDHELEQQVCDVPDPNFSSVSLVDDAKDSKRATG